MIFSVCTLFPEMFAALTEVSVTGRACKQGLIDVRTLQIRDYSADKKHHKVDDYTYGGGAGMLMCAQPVFDCVQDAVKRGDDGQDAGHKAEGKTARVIYLTPQGRTFTQEMARDFAKEEHLVLICGHYEGIDERALEALDAEYVSVGDYVLTGGELPAMVLIDAVSRLVPGVLSNDESAETESFDDGLLEYPQYTRPEVWRDKRVPEVLLSGDHAKVDAWRYEQSILRTKQRRPDLYRIWDERNGRLAGD